VSIELRLLPAYRNLGEPGGRLVSLEAAIAEPLSLVLGAIGLLTVFGNAWRRPTGRSQRIDPATTRLLPLQFSGSHLDRLARLRRPAGSIPQMADQRRLDWTRCD